MISSSVARSTGASRGRGGGQVDEHAAALHAVERHVLEAEVVGEGAVAAAVARGVVGRPDEVGAGAVAVVVDGLLDAVAVGVELGADVGERVPLRRVLQREGDDVVGPHVDVLRVAEVRHLAHVDVVEDVRRCRPCPRSARHRRVAPLVQGGAAGEVERQAEAEADAGLDLAHALEHLLGGEQVDAAELVVVAPVAPGRAVRALLPPLRHGVALYRIGRLLVPIARIAFPRREAQHDARRTSSSRATGTSSSRSTCSGPASRRTCATAAVWEEDFEMTSRRRGRRHGLPPAAHARATRAGRSPATARRSGRTPEGDPELILEDMDLDGVDVAGDAPEPLAVRALLRRPRAVDGPRPRLQRLRRRAVRAVLRPHLPDRAGADHRHRRRGRRDRAGRRRRAPGRPPAGHAADAVLHPRPRPGVGRALRPPACSRSSTPRPAA